MAEVLGTFIMFLIFLFFVVVLFKYRRLILEWLNDAKPAARYEDLRDLAILKRYGVEDAVSKVKMKQETDKAEREALRPAEKKTETGG